MKYIFIIGMLFSYVKSTACDLCGGVGSNASIGIFAANRFHLLGVRQNFRGFHSYLNAIKHSSETIWMSDLYFRSQVGKRVQLYGSIPFQVARQKTDFNTIFLAGFSDPNVLGTFALIDKKDSNKVTRDFLNVGMGIKFPFGKFLSYQSDLKNLAPSTGSLDILLLTNYTHRIKNAWSLQTEASHSFKGEDRDGYRYGSSTQISGSLIYNRKVLLSRLISSIGFQYDSYQSSRLHDQLIVDQNNSGYVLAAKGSLNLMTSRFLISAQVQRAMSQNINEGSIQQKWVFGLSLNYLIQKKQHEKNNL